MLSGRAGAPVVVRRAWPRRVLTRYSVPRLVRRSRRPLPRASRCRRRSRSVRPFRRLPGRCRLLLAAPTRAIHPGASNNGCAWSSSRSTSRPRSAPLSRECSPSPSTSPRAGHDVTVICEFPNHPHGGDPPEYRGKFVDEDTFEPVPRAPGPGRGAAREDTDEPHDLLSLVHGDGDVRRTASGSRRRRLATSPPLFTGVAGAAIARLNRAPFVLDVRDLWPAAAVSLDQISSGLPLRIAEQLEHGSYREAAVVVAVQGLLRAHRPHPVPGSRDRVCSERRPWSSSSTATSPDAARRAGRPLPRHVCGHARNRASAADRAGGGRAAAGRSRHFAFVGDGPVKDTLVRRARARGLDNVVFHPQVPLEQVPAVLAGSDALIVPLSAHPTFADSCRRR